MVTSTNAPFMRTRRANDKHLFFADVNRAKLCGKSTCDQSQLHIKLSAKSPLKLSSQMNG